METSPQDPATPIEPAPPEPQAAAEPQAVAEPQAAAEPPSILESLAALAQASRAQRLAPAEEERAAGLLKELLTGGRAGIASAIEPLVNLPWIAGVNAVGAVWPDLSVPMRRHLLASLAKVESEPARRLRLSLARAIFKVDPPAGLKLAAATASDLKDPETGALPPRHRQMFFNVFVGKGKPWLLQLPLADLKPAEAEPLMHCALGTFPLCPPLSQLSILRWISAGGRFKKVAPADLEIAAKSIGRWNGKLQRQLKADVPDLPEALAAALKPEAVAAPVAPAPGEEPREEASAVHETPAPAPEPESPAAPETAAPESSGTPAGETPPAAVAAAPVIEEITIPNRNRRDRQEPPRKHPEAPSREPRPQEERRPERREERLSVREVRDLREPREEKGGRKPFDFKESLRGLESYVASLRTELEQAKAQLRRRDDDLKRGGRSGRPERGNEPAPQELEALTRHNAQLEGTVRDLRQQLEDLASHHESVAESRLLHTDQPLEEGSAEQLKALLSIKLQESFVTYSAMRLEPLDKVFRLDYRDLLGSVFDVLLHEGVKLEAK